VWHGAVGSAFDSLSFSREFELLGYRFPFFYPARNFTHIALYWFVPGTDSSVIHVTKNKSD